MTSSILSMSIDRTQNVPIMVGGTSAFNINIKNISSSQRLYNLGISLTVPDGMVLSTSTIPQTYSVTNFDNSITYSWINIKDLAPMEISFIFSITVKCNTKFKNGTTIPFEYNFSGIAVYCQVDTMPRGVYDIGNEVISNTISMTYSTVRFYSTITTAGKVLKGAGTSPSLNDYTQVTGATCKFFNNSVSSSLVNITILLEDGIRYIGNIITSGTDASKFSTPNINLVNINGKLYTQLYYGNINLSTSSSTTLIFSYAVWNQYNSNQGSFIKHGTILNMSINMKSADPLAISNSDSSTSFTAMDLIINTSINKSTVDVQSNVTYTYVYKVGQYYNIQDIVVHYFLPDGIFYISSSSIPASAVDNPTLQGYYITYNFSLTAQNSTKTIVIIGKVDNYYRYKKDSQALNLPVAASDFFLATADISGTIIGSFNSVSDNTNINSSIGIGIISKQFVKGYYKNGTHKTINALAPGDLAEYTLTYNASTLKAIQKETYIDDFFPLTASPIDNLTYVYTGINPVSLPQLISPHGVDFYYGNITGLSSGTINFKVPISQLGSASQNSNLMKLKGINTYGYSYSSRSQVTINIGAPNLSLTKSVTGPNKSAIQANEIYTYSITISNSNNLGTETDAFDFTLNDTLSATWFIIDKNSINITGTGSFTDPVLQNNNIVLYINKLAPGQYLTLTYKVTISSVLAPGVNITTTAATTNPYSQVYDSTSTNFQYSNLNKSASITISSSAVTLAKTNFNSVFKVGSLITYTLTVTIPQGTIAYSLYIKDTLPSDSQSYIGPSYKNSLPITTIVSSNIVTFPNEGIIDARTSTQTIIYIMTSKITGANKSINAISSTQTNTFQCLYQQIQSGSFTTISKSLIVTINHPNLLMTLTALDKTTSILYTQIANINTNAIVQFKLIFQNNSTISLTNGTIEIPIDNNFLFYSIDTTVLCSATFNITSKKIIITIPQLASFVSGYMSFTIIPQSTLRTCTSISTQAAAISYYNDISSTKVYNGEKSNILTCALPAGVSLMPNPLYKIDDSTAFIVTPLGNTAVILDYFKNTGGGYDDFTLIIQKVALSYSLYIDDVKINDIQPNTLYQADLPAMANLPPNITKIIKITTVIPSEQSLGIRYDFKVTVKSKTSPYPEKTVINIDPNPF
ncbi:isopeptide-forming domain-containing fimbrial protein [Clostridium sp. P21]|uniref:Isopeptide-forming domain-containing fimbrial protein n=1 Tax=Clostridium muellerianum TaxID=2716538 RepID=A0A7Y0HM56_9CLOT|nr:isopeptide-forming domain-containing fimbrial protein [Clostridium muellerianum]NMM62654.1 isopeptide-forming domain-containing fimbrial protein [Clostridium muellerianum]